MKYIFKPIIGICVFIPFYIGVNIFLLLLLFIRFLWDFDVNYVSGIFRKEFIFFFKPTRYEGKPVRKITYAWGVVPDGEVYYFKSKIHEVLGYKPKIIKNE